MGLMQVNMTWLSKKGLSYQWLLELFERLKLPLFDGIAEALKIGNEEPLKKQTEVTKQKRNNWKES